MGASSVVLTMSGLREKEREAGGAARQSEQRTHVALVKTSDRAYGVKAAVGHLLKGAPANVAQVTTDEEMFI